MKVFALCFLVSVFAADPALTGITCSSCKCAEDASCETPCTDFANTMTGGSIAINKFYEFLQTLGTDCSVEAQAELAITVPETKWCAGTKQWVIGRPDVNDGTFKVTDAEQSKTITLRIWHAKDAWAECTDAVTASDVKGGVTTLTEVECETAQNPTTEVAGFKRTDESIEFQAVGDWHTDTNKNKLYAVKSENCSGETSLIEFQQFTKGKFQGLQSDDGEKPGDGGDNATANIILSSTLLLTLMGYF